MPRYPGKNPSEKACTVYKKADDKQAFMTVCHRGPDKGLPLRQQDYRKNPGLVDARDRKFMLYLQEGRRLTWIRQPLSITVSERRRSRENVLLMTQVSTS